MQNRDQYTTVHTGMLVIEGHLYRRLEKLISFKKISCGLKKLTNKSYGKERIFKKMLIQYMEDLSDREMERYLQENLAAKYFCGFSMRALGKVDKLQLVKIQSTQTYMQQAAPQ